MTTLFETTRVPANLETLSIGDRVGFKHQRREGMVTGCQRSGNLGFTDRKQEWMLTVAYFSTGGACMEVTLPIECFEAIVPNPNCIDDDDEEEDLGPRAVRKAKTKRLEGSFANTQRRFEKQRGLQVDDEEPEDEGPMPGCRPAEPKKW